MSEGDVSGVENRLSHVGCVWGTDSGEEMVRNLKSCQSTKSCERSWQKLQVLLENLNLLGCLQASGGWECISSIQTGWVWAGDSAVNTLVIYVRSEAEVLFYELTSEKMEGVQTSFIFCSVSKCCGSCFS